MGKLAEIKTKETDSSVVDFINKVADEQKRKDSFTWVKLMEKATKEKPKMWGSSMIGFGDKRYKARLQEEKSIGLKSAFLHVRRTYRYILPPI
jgi:hypothetical protein